RLSRVAAILSDGSWRAISPAHHHLDAGIGCLHRADGHWQWSWRRNRSSDATDYRIQPDPTRRSGGCERKRLRLRLLVQERSEIYRGFGSRDYAGEWIRYTQRLSGRRRRGGLRGRSRRRPGEAHRPGEYDFVDRFEPHYA